MTDRKHVKSYKTTEEIIDAISLCNRITKIRALYTSLSAKQAPKEILDLVLKTRIRLETKNCWRH